MRRQCGKFLESHRVAGSKFNGAFLIGDLRIICSDGLGWEHVSVSLADRTPTWEEMCYVKDLFWDEHEWVVQYHPPKSLYVNNHPFCLHLWRPTTCIIPAPLTILVGIPHCNAAGPPGGDCA